VSSAGRWISGSKGSGSSYCYSRWWGAAHRAHARSWAPGRQGAAPSWRGAARKSSEMSLLDGVPYVYIQYSSSSSPLVATSDLARFIPIAALALARTMPLGLVIFIWRAPELVS